MVSSFIVKKAITLCNMLRTVVLSFVIMCCLLQVHTYARNSIAVVKNRYDNVERVLRVYQINFDTIEVKDLMERRILNKYDSLYLPSGVDKSLETNINVLARKKSIQSVNLKQNVITIENSIIVRNIKNFIENGGSVYCSGYSYKVLQKAYNPFIFHRIEENDFPNMGLPGRLEVRVNNDMALFCSKPTLALYMNYNGWIALKAINDGIVLTNGAYTSPVGIKNGPISVLLQRGKGEALYTSYYSTVYSEYKRFNVLRVAGSRLINQLEKKVHKWTQQVTGRLVDIIAEKENFRKYRLPLLKGENSIYFYSKALLCQIDVYDNNMSLIESRDGIKDEFSVKINSVRDTICYIKIYPASTERNGLFAFVAAHGKQVRHKWIYITVISSILIVLISIIVFIKIMRRHMYISMMHRH